MNIIYKLEDDHTEFPRIREPNNKDCGQRGHLELLEMKKRAGCVVGLGLVEMEIEGMGIGEITLGENGM